MHFTLLPSSNVKFMSFFISYVYFLIHCIQFILFHTYIFQTSSSNSTGVPVSSARSVRLMATESGMTSVAIISCK